MEGLSIYPATSEDDMDDVRTLFCEYQEWLGVDLCFQDFEAELAALPGLYAPPQGRLFLVRDEAGGDLVACVAVRPRDGDRCEMKRLYVRKPWRGRGLGRHLTELSLEEARAAGHRRMCLDTLAHLHEARALYKSMGFKEIPAYYDNPLDGVTYLELALA